jgi:hypothetical protein
MWILVQHADSDLAKLTDRILVAQGKPQRVCPE